MSEEAQNRLKRLRMRSWRRGMREMDLLLGPFADSELAKLPPETLDLYEDLLAESDPDLYVWLGARRDGPARYAALLRRIAEFHGYA